MGPNKRGQTATEYLIILAVVIVIALIVIGVLGGFPSIGGSSKTRTSEVYWGSADIAITAHSFDAAGASNVLKLRNNLRNRVTVNTITIGSTTVMSTATTIASGGSTTFEGSTIASHIDCGDSGDPYSYDVSIAYTDVDTSANYTFTGSGTKLEGSCSG